MFSSGLLPADDDDDDQMTIWNVACTLAVNLSNWWTLCKILKVQEENLQSYPKRQLIELKFSKFQNDTFILLKC